MKVSMVNQDEHNRNLIYRCLLNGGVVTFTTRTNNSVGVVIECPPEDFPIFAIFDQPFKSFVLTPDHTYFESFNNAVEAKEWLGSTFGEGKFIDLS